MDKNTQVEFTPEGYKKVLEAMSKIPENEKKVLLETVVSCFVGNAYD